jgi:hypothetical protein
MGTFRTVFLKRPCERCGREMAQGLQFKTGRDYLEEYQLGQIVKPDGSLCPGERYPGAAWRYCGPCAEDWGLAAKRAWFEALADGVRSGILEVLDKELRASLTADELLRRAEAAGGIFNVTLNENGDIVGASFNHPVEILWPGEARDPRSQAHFRAQFALNDVMDGRMKAAGWANGRDDIREDVEVYLDEDSRIQAHFP